MLLSALAIGLALEAAAFAPMVPTAVLRTAPCAIPRAGLRTHGAFSLSARQPVFEASLAIGGGGGGGKMNMNGGGGGGGGDDDGNEDDDNMPYLELLKKAGKDASDVPADLLKALEGGTLVA
jgi:hypothetical protein